MHLHKDHPRKRQKGDRREKTRLQTDRARELALTAQARKLQSLLELGQLIGLDLQLNEMLLRIAQKAAEVMEADRCSLFLYDPKTNELWSTVALGMGEQVIRIRSGVGAAGYCFKTGEVVNLKDTYRDPRFNKEVDARTGYHTQSLLCMPLYNRAGEKLGVIQLLNKKGGGFERGDESFLRTFGNHASVFIEIAQLQKARIDALEQSRAELECLNRAKSKALDHLSHELRTPLAVIRGKLKLLARKLQEQKSPLGEEKLFDTLEKHLNRLLEIQQETDKIIRTYQGMKMENLQLVPIVENVLERAREQACHRGVQLHVGPKQDVSIITDRSFLEDMLIGLTRNAIENTPDEGKVEVSLEEDSSMVFIHVQDSGIGISGENQKFIFDGLFHTQETELYTSGKPYDFYAGGKGLDLHRMKVHAQRLGIDLAVKSRRCPFLTTDKDVCPGRISACPHCQNLEDCFSSGGSTFSISFQKG
ncbi:MAG TPA: GAF domain-containing sensor histidine kinase [Thermodesulfobacteriota bacterium]|nr:GAF domain-containing sensor histidine kinase [Thermodesulfobacteriota bacterium]